MKNINDIYIGKTPFDLSDKSVSGAEVLIGDENFYKKMAPRESSYHLSGYEILSYFR